jgi:hypothetical protein
MQIAAQQFIAGADFGSKYPNAFYNTLYSNSIGQCFALLLISSFKLKSVTNYDFVVIRKMTILAYLHLSKCISIAGEKAYDSLKARAELLTKHKYHTELLNVFDAFNVPATNIPLLSSVDYKDAAKGYFMKNMVVVQECLENADFCFNTFQKVNKIRDGRQEIESFGREYHGTIFSIMEQRYKDGIVVLPKSDIESALISY